MRLTLFGAPRIEQDGQHIHVDTRKAFALIAYLAVQGGYQSRDTLCTLLWEDNDQTGARGALRRTLSALNSALDGTGLIIERDAIAFDAAAIWCDLTKFTEALHACSRHDHPVHEVCPRCLEPLTQAVNLYKSDFLKGFSLRDSAEFDLWQFQQAEYYRRQYAGSLEKLIRLHVQSEQYAQAILLAQRWLALDSLQEAAHAQLIQLYAWSGQRALAIRQYHDCVRILEQELGVPPLDETTRLYQQVMDHAAVDRPVGDGTAPRHLTPYEAPAALLPFAGREPVLVQMNEACRASGLKHAVIVVEGEAGVGKTRLVEHFAAHHHAEGAAVVRLRCYESEGQFAYAPLIRTLREHVIAAGRLDALASHWISELCRLLPEIQPPRSEMGSAAGDTTAAQTRLYEAVCQALMAALNGQATGLLLIDDAQWVDSATLDWLVYWLRRGSGSAAHLVMTWRTEDVGRGHRLRLLLGDYERNTGHVSWLRLPRLTFESIRLILHGAGFAAADIAADDNLLKQLYDESEGLPLFVHEYVKLLQTNPSLRGERNWHIPAGVHQLLLSRVVQVSDVARQALETAAVIGRTFDLDLVEACSGRTEGEIVDGADELQRRGLWQERREEGRYEFHHEKMRTVVYQEMSMARRRLLHRRLAQAALNRVRQTEKRAAAAAVIAHHFYMGGQEQLAAEHYFLAGGYAREVFANQEALSYFEHSLALGYPETAELYRSMGDVNTILGHYQAAIYNYEAAIAHASASQMPHLVLALGKVYGRLGEWDLAEHSFESAFSIALDKETSLRSALLAEWSLVRYSIGDMQKAQLLAQSALAVAQHSGSVFGQAQALNMMGILARQRGELQEALGHLQQSVQLAESLGDAIVYVAALNNLALTYVESRQYEQAEGLWELALEQCVRQGDRHREAALHNHLSDLYHTMEQHERAMKHLKRAVSLFAQIGIDGQGMKPEIWKLAEW